MNRLICLYTCLLTISISCINKNSKSKEFQVTLSHSRTISHETPITSIIKSNNEHLDSVNFVIDNVTITLPYSKTNTYSFPTKDLTLGVKNIVTIIYYDSNTETHSQSITITSNITPTYPTFSILQTYEHSITSYTQGLEFDNDSLYESTGLYGESSLHLINIKNGSISKTIPISQEYFGEGITILHNRIYQLTWKSNIGFVYDKASFRQIGTFNYTSEGWGICNDGENLIMSDGTEFLYIYNPESFSLIKKIAVYDDKSAVTKLNELEFVDGYVYANVYQTDFIVKIELQTGKVIEWINLKTILEQKYYHEDIDVLNGIAWNKKSKTFFITGKKWPKMFEVTFNTNQPL